MSQNWKCDKCCDLRPQRTVDMAAAPVRSSASSLLWTMVTSQRRVGTEPSFVIVACMTNHTEQTPLQCNIIIDLCASPQQQQPGYSIDWTSLVRYIYIQYRRRAASAATTTGGEQQGRRPAATSAAGPGRATATAVRTEGAGRQQHQNGTYPAKSIS